MSIHNKTMKESGKLIVEGITEKDGRIGNEGRAYNETRGMKELGIREMRNDGVRVWDVEVSAM